MTIGKQLRQLREARNLNLEEVAQATQVRVRYLQALEAEQFDQLPSPAHVRGFLRAYAAVLKVDPAPLLAELDGIPALPAEQLSPAPAAASLPVGSPQAIFTEIGEKLKSQRELLGLSLEDVERHTHIRMHYVRALESGDLNGLPSPVQGRGMLSNYASFLGMDTDSILLRFADGLQAQLASRQARQPTRPASRQPQGDAPPVRPSALRRLLSADLFIGGIIVLFLIAFTVWGTLRVSELRSAQQPTTTAPSISDVLLDTPLLDLSPTPTLAPGTGQLTGTPGVDTTPVAPEETLDTTLVSLPGGATATPDFGAAPVQVFIIVRQRAWVRVTVDGEVVFEGRMLPGSAYPFAAVERVELITGNGAGLQVIFNQQDLGVIGQFGEVVLRVFTVQGVIAPTPIVPPTATPAPTATPGTPTPTILPTP